MPSFVLPKPQGFDLRAAADFYASFTPGSGMAAADVGRLTLAFHLDETFEPVVVALDDAGDSLRAECSGTLADGAVARQVARILGLDADGDAWRAVGERDPVVGKLQAEFPGFFTAAKASPYDAATWAILAPRMGIAAASRLKMAIAEAHGHAVAMDGRTHFVFPRPTALLRLERFAGLPEVKLERLHGIARAALAGRLDAERLRAMPPEEALSELMTLKGVGPWAASHIFVRGAAPPDALPAAEPRVLHGFAAAYGVGAPSEPEFARAAERWRPFRMWVCVLLSRHLAKSGAWRAPGLTKARANAGKALERRLGAARPGPTRPRGRVA